MTKIERTDETCPKCGGSGEIGGDCGDFGSYMSPQNQPTPCPTCFPRNEPKNRSQLRAKEEYRSHFISYLHAGRADRSLQAEDSHDKRLPGRITGQHWWQVMCERLSTGEDEAAVLNDYGLRRGSGNRHDMGVRCGTIGECIAVVEADKTLGDLTKDRLVKRLEALTYDVYWSAGPSSGSDIRS